MRSRYVNRVGRRRLMTAGAAYGGVGIYVIGFEGEKQSWRLSGLAVPVRKNYWLNLQAEYDLRIMNRKIWVDIERRIIPLKQPGEGIQPRAQA